MGCQICSTVDEEFEIEKRYDKRGLFRFFNKSGECYINSILQIFLHNELILNTLESIKQTDIKIEQNEGKLIFEIKKLIIDIKNNKDILDNSRIKDAMILINEGYKNNSADINDFICDLINELTEELPRKEQFKINLPKDETTCKALNKLINKFYLKNNSIFLDLFFGNTMIEYICNKGHLIDVKFMSFITLDFSLYSFANKKNIELNEILDYKFSIKQQEKEKFCHLCGEKISYSEKEFLYSIPNILIIFISRKINNQFCNNKIVFNVQLNLNKYIKNNSENNPKFKLFGIVQNNIGHFCSATINNYDKNWYFFNDSNEPILVNNEIDKFNPQLLFYFKTY